MTIETQTYVTLDEVVGFVFKCPKCHANISIPVSGLNRILKIHSEQPSIECPQCEEVWFNGVRDERFVALKKFFDSLVTLRNKTGEMTCGVMMELKSGQP